MALDWANLGPYEVVTFRGKRMNARDAAQHLWAEQIAGFRCAITQGNHNAGSVTASAGTHDGGGVLDWSIAGMRKKKQRRWVNATKDAGWCSWRREAIAGLWPLHAHGVSRGCKNLAPVAKEQIPSFDAGRDGLKSQYPDPTYRPDPKVEFDYKGWKADHLRASRLTRALKATTRRIKSLRNEIATLIAERDRKRKVRKGILREWSH